MVKVLGNIILYLSLTSGAISALDFCLSEKFKKKIKSVFETIWIWLEYKKLINFYRVQPGGEFIITISAIFLFVFNYFLIIGISSDNIAYSFEDYFSIFANILLIITVCSLIDTFLYILFPSLKRSYLNNKRYILETDKLSIIIVRSITVGFHRVVLIPVLISKFIDVQIISLFVGYNLIVLTGMWIPLIIWAAVIPFIKLILKSLSYFIYRIISFPKGPLVFFTSLISAILAFLKIFTEVLN